MKEQVAEMFESLKLMPEPWQKAVRKAIGDDRIGGMVEGVASRFKITDDQEGGLVTETLLTICGMSPVEELRENLIAEHGLDFIRATCIHYDFQAEIIGRLVAEARTHGELPEEFGRARSGPERKKLSFADQVRDKVDRVQTAAWLYSLKLDAGVIRVLEASRSEIPVEFQGALLDVGWRRLLMMVCDNHNLLPHPRKVFVSLVLLFLFGVEPGLGRGEALLRECEAGCALAPEEAESLLASFNVCITRRVMEAAEKRGAVFG